MTDEVFKTEEDRLYQMINIISSFAENKAYLYCPTKIRKHVTQLEYIALCEHTYPTIMEQILLEEQKEKQLKRKRKIEK
ncbi:TPA: hypothetical protein ACPI87_001443 [Haemophilus influenzae]|uniref:hypothetical protein n=1 Tax=Haemophilus influenzae TaxID=727 RepID=UPI0021593FE3|nr:hypothetical protein [Haemophilus influenzae]